MICTLTFSVDQWEWNICTQLTKENNKRNNISKLESKWVCSCTNLKSLCFVTIVKHFQIKYSSKYWSNSVLQKTFLTEVFEGFMGALEPIYTLIYYPVWIIEGIFMTQVAALFAKTTTDHTSICPTPFNVSRVAVVWAKNLISPCVSRFYRHSIGIRELPGRVVDKTNTPLRSCYINLFMCRACIRRMKLSLVSNLSPFLSVDGSLYMVPASGFIHRRDHLVINLGWSVYCKSVTKLRKSGGGVGVGEGDCWPTFQLLFLSSKITKPQSPMCLGVGGGAKYEVRKGLLMLLHRDHIEPQFRDASLVIILQTCIYLFSTREIALERLKWSDEISIVISSKLEVQRRI